MAYEAGTAILEVVPSFKGIEASLARGARALAKGLDEQLGGSLGRAMDKAAADSEKSSERAGRKLGQIFAERAIKQVETALGNIPDSDRVLKPLRKELEALAKIDLGRGFDEKDFLRRVEAAYKGLRRAQQDAQGPNGISRNVNAGNAAAALGSVQEIVRAARERGFEAGDTFTNAYQSRLRNMRAALPDIKVSAASSPDERRAAALRQNIQAAQQFKVGDVATRDNNPLNLKIGAKIDAADLKRVMGTLEGQLDQFSEQAGQIELILATDKARAQAGAFFDDVKTDAQRAAEDEAASYLKAWEDAHREQARRDQRLREEYAKLFDQIALDEVRRDRQARDEIAQSHEAAIAEDYKREKRKAEDLVKARRDALAAAEASSAKQLQATSAGRVQAGTRSASAAIQNIPVHLQGENIEREMAAIRRRLELLGGFTIGVDADTSDFVPKIEKEFNRLKQIAKDKTVRIDIRTDAARAATELGAVLVALNRIDGKKAEVTIDTDRANAGLMQMLGNLSVNLSRLGALVAIGASLGTAIVPAAAAAASAIGAIGTAAFAAAAGVGVMILGFSGIGEAVGLMDKAATSQAKTSKSLNSSANAMAGAQDQLRSADIALANTRRNNAQAALKAQRAIKDSVLDQRDAVREVQRANQDAVQAYADARRDASRADVAAARAQLDLSDAYRDAQRAIEDLNSAVRGNALDQRQAALDIAEAKEALDKVTTNPRATLAEREQADITYQQRLLQMDDLRRKADQMGQEQEKRFAVGIKGSDEVKKAELAVSDATEGSLKARRDLKRAEEEVALTRIEGQRKIKDAQQKVADAQSAAADQQKDAAYSIFTATQSVAAAQRALSNAYAGTSVAGGAALDNLKTKLAAMTPAGRDFATYLFGLKDAFLQLKTAADPMVRGVQRAIESLLGTTSKDAVARLQPLFDFVGRVATELGAIFVRFAATLKGPALTRFFRYISDTAVPTLDALYTAFENTFVGAINLFLAFAPLSKGVTDGFVGMTASFRRWSEGLAQNRGFQQFLGYLQQAGPQVAHMLGQLVEAVSHLVIAAAPIGTFVVGAFTKLLEVINDVPQASLDSLVKGLAAAAAAIGAFAAATTIAKLSTAGLAATVISVLVVALSSLAGVNPGVAETLRILAGLAAVGLTVVATVKAIAAVQGLWITVSGLATTVQTALTAAVVRYQVATVGATTSTGLLNGALFATGAAGAKSTAALGMMKAVAGPLAVVLAGVAAIWGVNEWHMRSATEATDELGPAMQELARTAQEAGDSAEGLAKVDDAFRRMVATNEDMKGTVKTLQDMGLGIDTITQAVTGNAQAVDQATKAIEAQITRLDEQQRKNFFDIVGNEKLSQEQERLFKIRDELAAVAEKTKAAGNANKILEDTQKRVADSTALLTPAQKALGDAQRVLADKTSTVQQKMDALKTAQDATHKATIDAIDSDEAYHSSLLALKEGVAQAKGEHEKYATSLDRNNQIGLRNRDTLEALVESANKAYDADVALNGITQKAIDTGKGHIEQIRETARHLGLSKTATDKLIASFNQIPENVETAIGFKEGQFDKVYAQLEEAFYIQKGLQEGKDPATVKHNYKTLLSDRNRAAFLNRGDGIGIPGHATGGKISGPGTKTSDSVLMWGSTGEFMQPAHAVDYYGTGIMEAIRRKAIPRDWFQGLATGGMVKKARWPFPIDLSKTLIPSAEDLQSAVYGGSLGGAQGGRGWQWEMNTLHKVFRGLALISGVRPGARTLSGNLSYHALGRAVDVPPIRRVAEWIAQTYGASTKELITPWRDLMLRNGKPYKYSRAIEAQHGVFGQNKHIHWAYDKGGLLPDTRSMPGGVMQMFHGRKTPDKVLTDDQWQNMSVLAGKARESMSGGDTYNFPYRDTTLDIDELNRWTSRRDALNRVNRVNY